MVSTARSGAVLRVTLQRPEKRNALNRTLAVAACDAIKSGATDPSVATIVLAGEGGTLSAGADLGDPAEVESMRRNHPSDPLAQLPRLLRSLDVPTVAVVDGYALGAGAALAGATTFTVATHRSVFGLPEAAMGFFPYGIVPYLVGRVAAPTVLEWALSARRIPAEEAALAGLVTHLVDDDGLDEAVNELTEALSHNSASVARNGMRWLAKQQAGVDPSELISWCEAEIQRAATG